MSALAAGFAAGGGPSPNPLPGGEGFSVRLRHGPIDLEIRAWGMAGAVRAAIGAAQTVFPGILPALVAELPLLRTPLPGARPGGVVAGAMHDAVGPFAALGVTPMAAVAGAVADHVLGVMTAAAPLDRAFVNNGGDIAFHLAPGQALRCGLVTRLDAPGLDGAFVLRSEAPSRGIATSGRACKGRGGRSFSFGIADSVTVLAATAAQADAAASIVGNAVDLPGHPGVIRRPACDIDPDSDLGARLVTWDVGALDAGEVDKALDAGRRVADALLQAGLIHGAVLALAGRFATCWQPERRVA